MYQLNKFAKVQTLTGMTFTSVEAVREFIRKDVKAKYLEDGEGFSIQEVNFDEIHFFIVQIKDDEINRFLVYSANSLLVV